MLVKTEADKQKAIAHIERIKPTPEKPWVVTGEPFTGTKTDQQRGWFHHLCRELGREIGMREGEVKDMAKAKLFGLKTVQKWGLELVIPDAPSTEKLPKNAYSDLIAVVYELGAEAGVYLPDPVRDL